MKKIHRTYGLKAFVAIMFLGVGTAAHAQKPKISILHCGVDEVNETMVYKAISVSKASWKGHGNHIAGSIDSEGTGEFADSGEGMVEEVFVDYVRNGADCLLGDDNDLSTCDGPVEGDICGTILEPAT